METNDQNIFQKISQGDENAFECMFRMYYPQLIIFAQNYISSLEEAEEIVQDLFCNLWLKREKIIINQSIKAYLYNATRNNCFDSLKHEKVKTKYLQNIIFERKEEITENKNLLISEETTKRILDAIESLPEKTKNIFKMNRFEGLKYREIAEKLEISQKTVENQMGMALKKLRESLGDIFKIKNKQKPD